MSSSSSSSYSYSSAYFDFWSNITGVDSNITDFDSQLRPPDDVSVDTVLSSLMFNAVVFLLLMGFYEALRRLLPTVYSSRKRMDRTHLFPEGTASAEVLGADTAGYLPPHANGRTAAGASTAATTTNGQVDLTETLSSLPDDRPLDWIGPVFGVPWSKVRRIAGLDGYFFLRFIRMNVRITAVSSFWFFLILVPIYATGGQTSATGWYHLSASNIQSHSWRMWAPVVFAYLFSAFVAFVIKQEYRHFLELRQDFLAKGSAHVDPQHHYSLMIENIPYELRSDRALKEYFEKLFPGRVHSATVVLKLPDLEEAWQRCLRTCRRLEKSIAYLEATGSRPTHIVGRGRISILGVDLQPLDCSCKNSDVVYVDDSRYAERPARGTRVDSISYYTQELAADSRTLFKLQQRKLQIAESGNMAIRADNWLDQAVRDFKTVADRILDDSVLANDLLAPENSFDSSPDALVAEHMTSRYGSFSPATLDNRSSRRGWQMSSDDKGTRLVQSDMLSPIGEISTSQEVDDDESVFDTPFAADQYKSWLRRWAGRLGLDFVVAGMKVMNKQLDVALEGVVGATMSSTGFVTFLDLSSTTCAASAPLSVKASVLHASVAPEPREIRWENAHVSETTQIRRERIVNIVLFLGVILWSFPLAAIQAFAKAEYLAQIPGMEWIETFHGGALSKFVNGYLPVVALLTLILILPLIFEYIAVNYEHRKTFSDVQASMQGRYFYYQLANVYVTVTAGSILKSLASMLDHPSSILYLFGDSLPSMVGYFVALLVTKIMAGLPMIFLRFGALSRALLLKLLSNEKKLTQRELDAVYRLENVQYGWEFPTQLLVIVIVFTYAIICPIILPVGLLYFLGALVVYKKQVLYVYSPVYESGGAMFPHAVQRTMFGLVCGQMTLIGYMMTQSCYYQPLMLFPLPVFTVYMMNYFYQTYVEPSNRLSLERAREYDRMSAMQESNGAAVHADQHDEGVEARNRKFDNQAYRQPVLAEVAAEPWTYRRGVTDPETAAVREQLRRVNRYRYQTQLSLGGGSGQTAAFGSPI